MYVFTHTFGPRVGLKKPGELTAAKNFKLDIQAAKQLLSATGVSLPLEFPMSHWDVSVTGASVPDTATLAQSQWRAAGIASPNITIVNLATHASTNSRGAYEGAYLGPVGNNPAFGTTFYQTFYSPPEGVQAPTLNTGHVNNSELSALLQKQNTQFNFEERRQTLLQIQELAAEEMFRVPFSSFTANFFSDNRIRNNVVPFYRYAGSAHYIKYWWFE